MARAMKDSGIPWIGMIPEDWNLSRLQWCLEEIKEKNDPIKTTNVLSLTNKLGVIPYEEKGNQGNKAKEDYSQYGLAFENTLVINSMNVLIGSVGISKYYGCVSPVYYVYKNTDKADLRFINYLFQNNGFQKELRKYANGILEIRMRISSHDMLRRIIPLPDLTEQKRIADRIDTECARIDVVMEQTRASIEEYKKLKQSIITEAVTKGIRPNRPMKDSGIDWIGQIPDDWGMPKMNSVCSVITDYVASGSFASLAENVEYLDEPDYAMLIRTADISEKGYAPKPVYISKHAYDFLKNSNLFGGELMLPNIGASVGDIYIVPKLYERMSLAPNAIMVKTRYVDRFYYYYFLGKPGRLSIEDIAQSTAQAKFNKTDFRQLRVPLPSKEEQLEIAAYLDEKTMKVDALIAKKEKFLAEMESYKKSLIFEYVTGKRSVNA